jgi:hypothetical protein
MPKDTCQLARVLDDLKHGCRESLIAADRSVNNKIREQLGPYTSTPREGGATIYVWFSPFTRADLGGTAYTTLTGIKPSYTEGLIAHSKVFRAGATLVEGCEGQQFLEAGTSLPGAGFSANADGTSQASDLPAVCTGGTIGTNSMIFSPLRLSVKVVVSNQLLLQGGKLFESVFKDMLSRAVSGKLDDISLFGSGASGQPLGVFSTVTPINLAATPMTWGNFCGYRQVILQTDLDPDRFGVIVSPAMHNYLDTT